MWVYLERVFKEVIKYKWGHWGGHQYAWDPHKRGNVDTEAHVEGRWYEGMQGEVAICKVRRTAWHGSSLAALRRSDLADTSVWTSGLQDHETVHFCWLSTQSVVFVTAAPANEYGGKGLWGGKEVNEFQEQKSGQFSWSPEGEGEKGNIKVMCVNFQPPTNVKTWPLLESKAKPMNKLL